MLPLPDSSQSLPDTPTHPTLFCFIFQKKEQKKQKPKPKRTLNPQWLQTDLILAFLFSVFLKIFLINFLRISCIAFWSYFPLFQLLPDPPLILHHQILQQHSFNTSDPISVVGVWLTRTTLLKSHGRWVWLLTTCPSILGVCQSWACKRLGHDITTTVSSYVQLPCCVWKTRLCWTHLPPWALTTFLPPLLKYPWVLGEGVCYTCPI